MRAGACAWLVLSCGLAVWGRPCPSRACPPPDYREREQEWQAEERRRDARGARWRHQGLAAVPDIVRVGCQEGLEGRVGDALQALGPGAIPAIFDAQARLVAEGSDCSHPPSAVITQLLLATGDRQGGEVVLSALSGRDVHRQRAALWIWEALATSGADRRDSTRWLIDGGVGRLSRLLGEADLAMQPEVLRAMAALPARFRPIARRLEVLLDAPRLSAPALAVLSRMSPPSEGTVSWLRREIDGEVDPVRAGWLASRLATMRPAQTSALPELWRRLRRDEPALTCFTRLHTVRDLVKAILEIDPEGHASARWRLGRARELAAVLERAVRDAFRCDEGARTVEHVVGVLPRDAAGRVWLSMMTDREIELEGRRVAAAALVKLRWPLRGGAERVQKQLLGRGRRRGSSSGGDVRDAPEVRLSAALEACRQEAGATAPAPAIARPKTPDEERALSRAAECLELRLCEPESETYARAVETCCRYAFTLAPAWCGDAR